MKAIKLFTVFSILLLVFNMVNAQTKKSNKSLTWKSQIFELCNVNASLVQLEGEQLMKVERDLVALPFDKENLEASVDEPTYAKLRDLNFKNGVIEVKMRSQIQSPSPFAQAQGFIGLAFWIDENDSAFESIYLRPKVGRSDNQSYRNRTVQYYAYPDYKFDRLREEAPGIYETAADVGLDEWITFRIEVLERKATLYINNQKQPSFFVDPLKGKTTEGSVALWLDIGTIGYFKDLKITKY